jgi:23S rRNA (guanosine2251-2'-O)-methyltransferase
MQLIKGKHAIEEALLAKTPIKEIIVSQSLTHQKNVKDLFSLIKKNNVPLRSLPPNEFKQSFDLPQDQQVIAYVKEIPIQPLEKLIANMKNYPILICCDHLQDPYNFGAIIRTAYALGVNGIIFPKDRQVSLTPGVIKASSGAVYHMDLFQVSNLTNTLKKLKNEGYWVFGADQQAASPLPKTSFAYPSILIVGNEHKGISPTLQKSIDQNVSIPMAGQLDSLNVSVATGILLYNMVQQYGNTQ